MKPLIATIENALVIRRLGALQAPDIDALRRRLADPGNLDPYTGSNIGAGGVEVGLELSSIPTWEVARRVVHKRRRGRILVLGARP